MRSLYRFGAAGLALLAIFTLAPAPSGAQQRALRHPDFTASAVGFMDSLGEAAAEVRLEVAPAELSFVKTDTGYRAEVDIAITILDEKGNQVAGDIWRRVVDLPHYAELSRVDPILRERRVLEVRPGKLRVNIEVRDINADRSSRIELPVESVSAITANGKLALSGIEVGKLVDSTGTPRRGVVEGRVRKTFGNPLPRLACYGEVYAGKTGPDTVEIRGELFDEAGSSIETRKFTVHLVDGKASYLFRPDFDRLGVGVYSVRVQARWAKQKAQREEKFEMDETRIIFDEHFDQLLDILAIVADPAELDSLRKAPADQRSQRWDAFWQRHNPTPDGPGNPAAREFFQRIRFANQHFGGPSAGAGWRTDMGGVYIKYGPPDNTETHQQTVHEYATETWYYSEPRRMTFVFVDRGMGRFELVSKRGS